MKSLADYIRPCLPRMALGCSIKFLGTITDLLIPWMLARIVDYVIPAGNIGRVFLWGGMMAAAAAAVFAFNVIPNRMAAHVARDITERMRRELYEKISALSSSQVDRATIPSLISRVTSDTYNVHRMLNMIQRLGVRAPLLLAGGIIVTMSMEAHLGGVLIAMMPVMGITIWLIARKGIPMYTAVQKKSDRLVQVVRENIVGVRVIKALSKGSYERERFEGVNSDLSHQEQSAGITMALSNPLLTLFLNCALVLIILLGAYLVNAGIAMIGQIIAFQSYFIIILNAVISISRLFVILSRGVASSDRITEILNLPEDLAVLPACEAAGTDSAGADGREEEIAFDEVSFSYLGKTDAVSGISFTLKKGETLGIIGATGSGKTTIAALLMRLYDADSGQVRIKGTNVRYIPRDVLHRMFGVVFQSDSLFSDTIRENIDFGRGLADEEIETAARLAQAKEFISARENGYSELLSIRGNNLSGGQKQRLLIARALAAHPEILILDDSSSALDYKTDAAIRKAIGEMHDVTSVIIAQRISSVMNADRILVLDNGRALGYGTHPELLAHCEVYREIAQSQLEIGPDSPRTRHDGRTPPGGTP